MSTLSVVVGVGRAQDPNELETPEECRIQHNASSPICLLPSEILALIFIHLAQMAKTEIESSERNHYPTPLSWIPRTNICRPWRDVSLSCPELWSNIELNPSPLTDLMLARSMDHPLYITFIADDDLLPAYEHVMEYRSRLRTIEIQSVGKPRVAKLLEKWEGKELPILESLTIRATTDDEEYLPGNVLHGAAALRILSLETTSFDCVGLSTSCLNLRELRLHQHWRDRATDENRPSLSGLLAFLRSLTRLEDLKICGYLQPPVTHRTHLRSLPPINLPLKTLFIKDHGLYVEVFLQHISVPHDAQVQLSFKDYDFTTENLATVDLSLSASRPDLFRFVQMGCNFHLWTRPQSTANESKEWPKANRIFHFKDIGFYGVLGCPAAFYRGYNFGPLLSMEALRRDMVPSSWLSIFSHLPHLTSIHVDCFSFQKFVSVLGRATDGDMSTVGPTALDHFPALSHITIRWMIMKPVYLDMLIEALVGWRNEGRSLPKVTMDLQLKGMAKEEVLQRCKDVLPELVVEWKE